MIFFFVGVLLVIQLFDKNVALASIMAKVARDRLMTTYDKRYPGYGFAQHKGYGTRQHAVALKRLGPCALHRLTYRPVKAAPAILKP